MIKSIEETATIVRDALKNSNAFMKIPNFNIDEVLPLVSKLTLILRDEAKVGDAFGPSQAALEVREEIFVEYNMDFANVVTADIFHNLDRGLELGWIENETIKCFAERVKEAQDKVYDVLLSITDEAGIPEARNLDKATLFKLFGRNYV